MKASPYLLPFIFLASTALLAQSSTAAPSQNVIAIVDGGGNLHTSIRLDSAGNPVISYSGGSILKVAHCGNATCTAGNAITTGDRKHAEGPTSLALNASGNPVVAYYFGDLDVGKSRLKMLFCQDPNCMANTTLVTGSRATQSGLEPSVVLDSAGNPVISYSAIGVSFLLVQHCGDATCSSNNVDTPVGGGSPYTGGLVLDGAGNPVIAIEFNSTLGLVHCGDPNCTSGNSIVTGLADLGLLGVFAQVSLALDAGGNPVMSYLNQGNNNIGDLHVLHCGDPNCTSGNSDNILDSTAGAQTITSIAIAPDGNPTVSYNQNNSNLAVAHCGDADCGSGTSITQPASGGLWNSMTLDAQGRPVVAFVGGNFLKVLHCATVSCQ